METPHEAVRLSLYFYAEDRRLDMNEASVAEQILYDLDQAGFQVVRKDQLIVPSDFGETVMKVKLASERLLHTCAEIIARNAATEARAENIDGIGARIKSERTARGWSLRRLGEESGATFSYIHSLESGKMDNPSLKHLLRIAQCFGISLDELVYGRNNDEDQ